MRKSSILTFATIAAFTLTACSNSQQANEAPKISVETTSSAQEEIEEILETADIEESEIESHPSNEITIWYLGEQIDFDIDTEEIIERACQEYREQLNAETVLDLMLTQEMIDSIATEGFCIENGEDLYVSNGTEQYYISSTGEVYYLSEDFVEQIMNLLY